MRKLILDNGTWLWKFVKGNVVIKNPQGKKFLTNISTISGISWDMFEKGYNYSLTPSIIKNWIEENYI